MERNVYVFGRLNYYALLLLLRFMSNPKLSRTERNTKLFTVMKLGV